MAIPVEDRPYRQNVGVMVVNPAGLIWAGQRLDNPGAWQMPQGGIDKGEEPIVAAYRELEEETSIPASAVRLHAQSEDWLRYDLPPELMDTLWKGKFRGQEQRWFLMLFEGDEAAIRIDTADAEFSAWRWMAFPDLLTHIVPFKRDVYRQVWAEFGPVVEAMRV